MIPFGIFKHVKYHKKNNKTTKKEMQSKAYNTSGTVTKPNTKIVDRG